MKVPQSRLDRGFEKYQKEYEDRALEVLRSGWYILGKQDEAFEQEFADYVGAKYCRGLASGLDALWIAFRVLGIGEGDEVLVQGNTYIASVMGITINGATPIFIEPDEYDLIDADRLEAAITDKTKAILVVHLYGQASNMGKIMEVANKHSLKVVEDCAQSHGAKFNGKMTGTFGDIGCFSFYPSKNLGAFGDAGAIVTDDSELAEKVRIVRNYGSEKRYYNCVIGANSRLDELQAGLLRVKLAHLDELVKERVKIAERYLQGIHNPYICLPEIREGATHVWHQFVIHCVHRDQLRDYLAEQDVGTIIHYPIPPHMQEGYGYLGCKVGDFPITERYANEVLSLPIYNGMTSEEQDYVIKKINQFEESNLSPKVYF